MKDSCLEAEDTGSIRKENLSVPGTGPKWPCVASRRRAELPEETLSDQHSVRCHLDQVLCTKMVPHLRNTKKYKSWKCNFHAREILPDKKLTSEETELTD